MPLCMAFFVNARDVTQGLVPVQLHITDQPSPWPPESMVMGNCDMPQQEGAGNPRFGLILGDSKEVQELGFMLRCLKEAVTINPSYPK